MDRSPRRTKPEAESVSEYSVLLEQAHKNSMTVWIMELTYDKSLDLAMRE